LKPFSKNPLAALGAIIILTLAVIAISAPLIAPYPPEEQNLDNRLASPSLLHPMGRDSFGRDILSRVLYGARISLLVGMVVVGISAVIGVLLGLISGYFGGMVDEMIMRAVDILLAFPGILLAIAIVSVLGPGLKNLFFALSLIGWVSYARLTRGQVLKVRELQYIEAARSIGAGNIRIIFHHILPNIISPVIIQATLGVAGVIIAEASLSFLGLGVQPPTPSLGGMLNEGLSHLVDAPQLTLFPGIIISLVVLAFNFLGDGLRDLLDPLKKS
jgi:peptide/nickel transport system permease protein